MIMKPRYLFILCMVLFLLGISDVSSENTDWQLVGGSGINTDKAVGLSLYVNDRIEKVLLVGYIDKEKGDKAIVRRYDEQDNRWHKIGDTGICEGAVSDIGVAYLATLESRDYYAAYKDMSHGGRATVMKCGKDRNTWEAVGKKGFSDGEVLDMKFILDNLYPHVGFIDQDNGRKPVVMTFMDDKWVKLETSEQDLISEDKAAGLAFYIDRGVSYVAFADRKYNDRLTVMMFDMPWVAVGNKGFSDARINYTDIFVERNRKAQVTRVYAAYQDYAHDKKLTVMVNDNRGEWHALGEKGFSPGKPQYISLAVYKHIPFVAFADCANEYKATVMYYGRDAWRFLGSPGFSEGGVSDVQLRISDGTAYVGYITTDKDKKVEVRKISLDDHMEGD
jgi:hypothetical protein